MRFQYVAAEPTGAVTRGVVDALTLRDAVRAIRTQGLLITDIRPAPRARPLLARLKERAQRISLLKLALLARHLALLLRAGITIDRSFEILVHQASSQGQKAVLEAVLEDIRRGEALAIALSRHPQIFP